ncbi:MAG: glycosyltransferase family 2 protein [Lachnospiraceae bacterium]|nr:glycosyltransferase family 2 protein [Lachnospiraceae bacterium]
MNTRVSVVIPNYNGKAYLGACMDALMSQSVRSFEVIVVDDASTDGSMEDVMRKYPENGAYPKTRYLRHARNRGFCASVNDGIAAAEAEYVILLNNDTEVEQGFVEGLWQEIRRDGRIFSVAAAMLSMQDPTLMDDAGDYYCALGWAFAPAKDKPAYRYDRRRKIFSACGGAAIYRKSLLQEIGGFDERHFAYLEDVDIGWRAKLQGYVNYYTPKACVRHAGSASSGSRHNAFKVKLTARNNLYLLYKNMPFWQAAVNFPLLLLGIMIKLLFFIKKGLGRAYLAGLWEGFGYCRGQEAKSRRVDFKTVPFGRQLMLEGELLWNILRRIWPE